MEKGQDKDCRGGDDCINEEHLCRVAKHEDLELIRRLVRDSRFFCRKCGRAAHDGVNLCKPARI